MVGKMQTIMTMIRIMMRPTNGAVRGVVPTKTAIGCDVSRQRGRKEGPNERFSKCSRKEKKVQASEATAQQNGNI